MALDDVLPRLADRSRRQVRTLFDRHMAGLLSERELIAAVAATVGRENVAGWQAGDMAVAAALSRQLGELVGPVGLEPWTADTSRLMKSVRTVLRDRPSTVPEDDMARSVGDRLVRLAGNEPVESTNLAMSEAMQAREVPGWTRQLDADPCPACQTWADGVVRPPSVTMIRHTGCACFPRPTFST